MFLCGGGSGNQTVIANERLNQLICHDRSILYVPFAMESASFASCFSWFQGEMKSVEKAGIEMVYDGFQLSQKDLSEYAAVYIGGGNTFKLLKELKDHHCIEPIRKYLKSGGVIFGGSAGAAIFGHDIDAVRYDDQNNVGLENTLGFNLVHDFSIAAHYTNGDEQSTRKITQFLKDYSINQKVIALPEEDTLLINGEEIEILGTRPVYLFIGGQIEVVEQPFLFKSEIIR